MMNASTCNMYCMHSNAYVYINNVLVTILLFTNRGPGKDSRDLLGVRKVV